LRTGGSKTLTFPVRVDLRSNVPRRYREVTRGGARFLAWERDHQKRSIPGPSKE